MKFKNLEPADYSNYIRLKRGKMLTLLGSKANTNLYMTDIDIIQDELRTFNRARDWDKFHNGKDLAIAITIEASELLESFLWKAPNDAKIEAIKEELADVLNYAFQMADKYNLDIKQIMLDKIRKNALKYPVEKAKGNAKKYNEL